jgi:hypothetical protein
MGKPAARNVEEDVQEDRCDNKKDHEADQVCAAATAP